MLRDLAPKIAGLILDMDGVVWRGDQPIGALSEIQRLIEANGYSYVFATNNSTAAPVAIREKLAGLGMYVDESQIVNSSIAAAAYARHSFPNDKNVYIIGESGLEQACIDEGFTITDDNPCAVIVGIDRCINFTKLKTATRLIRAGAAFIGTNGDRTFPTPRGLIPGAGSILAAVEAATDQKPLIVGKPEPTLYEIAAAILDMDYSKILVVGDRLDTDILGAQRISIPNAVVLTGISTLDEISHWKPSPTIIAESLTELLNGNVLH